MRVFLYNARSINAYSEDTMQISENSVVNIHYTLTNDAGEVLDTSDGREALMYLHGHHQIICKKSSRCLHFFH